MNDERVLYVDASAGASGDMILGALVDLGVPLAAIRRALAKLPVDGWKLRSRRVERAGLSARKIDVRLDAHDHDHDHGRNWKTIRRIVRGAGLEPGPRDLALSIFGRLFEAEAKAHGRDIERVHLHEAGATDAIVDIVGAAVALAHLAPKRIVVSPMTTGFGHVHCAHGVYPVPGPATALLVCGVPVRAGEIEVERLTPTGAAILTTIADAWGWLPPMRPEAVGLGAGDRDLPDAPNVLRMIVGQTGMAAAAAGESADDAVAVLECAVDDSTPQALAWAAERLFDAGALDVHTTAITMKKGRCGHRLTVLGRPAQLGELARVVLAETTSLGLRFRIERRVELARESRKIRTPYGTVRVKIGRLDGKTLQAWPEYEDCAALAKKHRTPLREVQAAALAAYRQPPTTPRRRR